MLRIAIALVVLCLTGVAGQAYGKRAYGLGGCGLGSLIIDPGGNQSSAASTNGSFGSQSFGITSGTSNCVATDDMADIKMQEDFIVANLGSLSKSMARGQGTSLVQLSDALGCSRTVFPQFATELQAGYADIFAAPGALAVLDATKTHLQTKELFNQTCTKLNI
jgi:hypothetical protein